MRPDLRKLIPLTLVAMIALLAAGCGGDSDTEGTQAEAGGEAASSVLGEPDEATGKPIVFGMLNLETGPVTFPQQREAAEAAVDYVNEYKGGIHGRPIELANCATDGQPATSTRCANQVVEEDPLLILGAADTGSSGAFPVYERAGLAYVGGVPFTPAESNAKNGAIFISLVVGDNSAMAGYAKEELGAKSAVVLQISDTQGKYTGSVIAKSLEGAGMEVEKVNVAPSASDLSSPAAEAVSASPDVIYVEVTNACAAMLKALQSVGNTATLLAIGSCSSPTVTSAAGSAAEGVYFPEPTEALNSGSEQAEITTAAFDKYAPKEMARESNAVASFGSVMNIWEKLNEAPESILEEPGKILEQFTKGSENPNWMAHPYTCNGKQVPTQEAVCNGYEKIIQFKEGELVTVTDDWVNGTRYYQP